MIISNTLFPSVSFMDFYNNILEDIVSYEILPVEETVIFSAKKFGQYFAQKNNYTPKLPILSIVTNTVQMDERAQLSWHATPSPEFIKHSGGTIFTIADFGIYYSPVQLTGTFDMSYIGTSYPQLLDFELHMNRLFKIQKYCKYNIKSSIVLPELSLKNIIPESDLELFKNEGTIPNVTLNVTGDTRYIIPFSYDVLVRLTSQSDQSKLFGDTELPEYMSSLSFEFITTFPNFLMFEIGSRTNIINLNIGINNDIAKSSGCIIDRINDKKYSGQILEFETNLKETEITFSTGLILNPDDVKVVVYDILYGTPVDFSYSIDVENDNTYKLVINLDDYFDDHSYNIYVVI